MFTIDSAIMLCIIGIAGFLSGCAFACLIHSIKEDIIYRVGEKISNGKE